MEDALKEDEFLLDVKTMSKKTYEERKGPRTRVMWTASEVRLAIKAWVARNGTKR